MIPHPFGNDSSRLTGHGFNMSKVLNIKNASICHSHVLGKNKQVIQRPMNSSQTTLLGSGLSAVARVPVAQTPDINPTNIRSKKKGEELEMGNAR